MKLVTLTFLLLLSVLRLHAQIEICDNAIDDDGDGLVDINDPDCICPEEVPSGLIPNPSFEGMECCPTFEAQFECATGWEQASAATSDYLHTCGTFTYPTWLGNDYRTPTPYPDGAGWVGFRDGNTGRPNYKEYVGACLNATMEVGKTYRLDFWLGFPDKTTFDGLDLTFYGHEDCNVLPFGNGDDLIGCPLNTPGWTQLYQERHTGQDEWINVIAEFTADRPYNVFVLGSGCDIHENWQAQPYFFVDRLALAETNEFDVPFAAIEGNICEEDLVITAPDGNYTYQWYKDGAALIGETDATITIPVEIESEGVYVVVFGVGTSCFYSEEYNLVVPEKETNITAEICEGQFYDTGSQLLTETDIYQFFLFSQQGCDSMVTIDLTVNETYMQDIDRVICEGDSVVIDNDIIRTGGTYPYTYQSSKGCDSTVILNLAVSTGDELTLTPRICQGESYNVDGQPLTITGTYPFSYTNSQGCDSTVEVRLIVLDASEEIRDEDICEGDTLTVGGTDMTTTDTYDLMLLSQYGCDSLITVNLTVLEHTNAVVIDTFCSDTDYTLLGDTYTEGGQYTVYTTNAAGCDSTIALQLTVVDRTGGLQLPADTTISLGESLTIVPTINDMGLTRFVWSIADDSPLLVDDDVATVTPLQPTVVTLIATDDNNCGTMDSIQLRISRDIGIHAPNIFSPNADNNNDTWRLYTSKSVASLDQLVVYDRWGNLVYTEAGVANANDMQGWEGNFQSRPAAEGIYVYYAELTALDGVREVVRGDITLVR